MADSSTGPRKQERRETRERGACTSTAPGQPQSASDGGERPRRSEPEGANRGRKGARSNGSCIGGAKNEGSLERQGAGRRSCGRPLPVPAGGPGGSGRKRL